MNMPLPTTESSLRQYIRAMTEQWNGIMDGTIATAMPYARGARIMAEQTDARRSLRKVLRRKYPHMSGDDITRLMAE